jgi:hypothetical protein
MKDEKYLQVCADGILFIQLPCLWTLSIVLFFFYLKYTTFRRLHCVSVMRWSLLSRAQSIELVPISGHQHQHGMGYINQVQTDISLMLTTAVKQCMDMGARPHVCGVILILVLTLADGLCCAWIIYPILC